MTIAACYVSTEGVILSADSTSTVAIGTSNVIRHYDHAQKLFEIGERGSTLGIVTWNLGELPGLSYRHLVAWLSDDLIANPPATVLECVNRWNVRFWEEYKTRLSTQLARYQALSAIPTKSPNDVKEMEQLQQRFAVGFCIGGHVRADRTPQAFVVWFNPGMTDVGAVSAVPQGRPTFWGAAQMLNRLLKGVDPNAYNALRTSPLWHGTLGDLNAIFQPHELGAWFQMPLREAIDWIYSLIFITIKAVKFAPIPPVCGGPIELAVITADREFRWVCHKRLDQAISDHSVPEAR